MRTTTSFGPARLAAITALLASAAACNGAVPPGSNGDLGNGTFSYTCDSDSDPVCDAGGVGTLGAIPTKLAVGARFTLSYTASPFGDDPGGSTVVEPASVTMLTQTETFGSSFKGLKPGLGAVLARRGDMVTDFVHVRIAAIDHVQVDVSDGGDGGSEGVSSLQIGEGQELKLRAFAVDEADEMLGGALLASWSSSDEQVATFDSLSTDNEVSVRGVMEGTATVRVELDDQVKDIEVTVGGAQ